MVKKVRRFFFNEQDISVKKADLAWKRSMAFMPKGAKKDINRQKWIEQVGAYYYHSLCLANFNPSSALVIFDNPAHVIAEAVVSQMAYNYISE